MTLGGRGWERVLQKRVYGGRSLSVSRGYVIIIHIERVCYHHIERVGHNSIEWVCGYLCNVRGCMGCVLLFVHLTRVERVLGREGVR